MLLDLIHHNLFKEEILDPLHTPVQMVDIQPGSPVIRLTHLTVIMSQIMSAASADNFSKKYMVIRDPELPAFEEYSDLLEAIKQNLD